jgi:transcriptional regulator with XRE-family HTH domain
MFTQAADLIEDLPKWLTIIRASRRLSLREIAEQTGLSIPAVSRAEQGLHNYTDTTVRILRWLGESS